MVVWRASEAGSLLVRAAGAGAALALLDLTSEVDAVVAVLALRTGARDVLVVAGTTDCRFVEGVARGAGFGATTLEGREVGLVAATLEGRGLDVGAGVGFGLAVVLGVAAFVVGFGTGCERIRTMLASLIKRP
jgi:hypothetical protein